MFYELSPHAFMEISPSKFCLSIMLLTIHEKFPMEKPQLVVPLKTAIWYIYWTRISYRTHTSYKFHVWLLYDYVMELAWKMYSV